MYAELHHRPLGTIGVISPWNGPIILSCMPLASIFSAGNRAMIKPSEFAPATAALLEQLVTANFDSSELAVINGDWQVAAAFAGLPFDHLLYTGSSRIAREVLKAAAENLVPVTLELGGKCPVIIGSGTQLDLAARRIVFGKLFHGGQVCVSPDYVFVPANQIQEFTRAVETAAAEMYPELEGSADYSPIVNSSHYQRLQDVITDAREQGTQILRLGSDPERSECRKALRFPFHLLLDPPEQTRAMHEELFGPIMVIKQYQQLDEAISYVRDHPKPLAGYFFGDDKQELALFLDTIQTGSVAVNDVVCQIFYEQIPFGGIGPSGNGRYRGVAGFRAFSNAMPVLTQAGSDGHLAPLRPPYGSGISDFLDQQIRVFY
jgi:coniferyl-aldehyde dehydrogenase